MDVSKLFGVYFEQQQKHKKGNINIKIAQTLTTFTLIAWIQQIDLLMFVNKCIIGTASNYLETFWTLLWEEPGLMFMFLDVYVLSISKLPWDMMMLQR